MYSTFTLLTLGLAVATATPIYKILEARQEMLSAEGVQEAADTINGQLTPGMTCNELKAAYASAGPDRTEQKSDWDALDVDTFFLNWVFTGNYSGDFQESFARPWGVGDAWRDNCDIGQGCPSFNCDSFGDAADLPDSAAAYMVLLAMAHLQDAIHVIHNDVDVAYGQFSATDAWFNQEFNTDSVDDPSTLLARSLITGIGTGMVALAVLTDATPLVAGTIVAQRIMNGISNAIDDPQPQPIETLADLQVAMDAAINPARTAIGAMFDELKFQGTYETVPIADILAHGEFLDSNHIPVLNEALISSADRQRVILDHVNAAALNWSWRRTRVFAMSFPMSQEEFDTVGWYAGNGDTRLRYYDAGFQRGFFYQSVYEQKYDALSEKMKPRIQNPPGWGAVDALGFNNWQILQSSYLGFLEGGYNASFSPGAWLDTIYDGPANVGDDIRGAIAAPGVFAVVQCPFDVSEDVPDAVTFNDLMAGPGALTDTNDKGKASPFYHCIGKQDKYGAKFEEFNDYAKWADDVNINFCDVLFELPTYEGEDFD